MCPVCPNKEHFLLETIPEDMFQNAELVQIYPGPTRETTESAFGPHAKENIGIISKLISTELGIKVIKCANCGKFLGFAKAVK
jgi:hypothetical protein